MWKNLDAFAKPRDDLRQKSVVGGLVTLLASMAALLLFVGQLYVYFTGVTRHSLHLSPSSWHPVPTLDAPKGKESHIALRLHVSFPHMACSKLDLSHDGVSYKDERFKTIHGTFSTVIFRPMIQDEWRKATGEGKDRFATQYDLHSGCTVLGTYDIPKVGGSFALGLSPSSWSEVSTFLIMGLRGLGAKTATSQNTTHYIHTITFGEPFPLMKNPLKDDNHVVINDMGGIALANVNVKLIPTRYTSFFGFTANQYQMSVTEHIVQPETLAQQGSKFLPGLGVTYDFTPLAVHHVEERDSLLVFISSLIGIVGGVFVTVKLITGCLVAGAQEIAKKID